MNQDASLVRYRVLAANRRHFSGLFFAVVAFSWSFGLAVWVTLKWSYPFLPAAAFLAAGAILVGGAFVAGRLLKRERSSFAAMNACWRAISHDQAIVTKRSVRPGAMALIAAGQSIAGGILMTSAAMLLSI